MGRTGAQTRVRLGELKTFLDVSAPTLRRYPGLHRIPLRAFVPPARDGWEDASASGMKDIVSPLD